MCHNGYFSTLEFGSIFRCLETETGTEATKNVKETVTEIVGVTVIENEIGIEETEPSGNQSEKKCHQSTHTLRSLLKR